MPPPFPCAAQVSRSGAVKGPWQKHEDDIILKCLEEGVTKWSDIADRVTGRIGKQCRERFFNHLDREAEGGRARVVTVGHGCT